VHDPLAGMRVTHAGFAAMARRLRSVADAHAGGRILALLEGGYDLVGVSGGMAEVLAALTAEGGPPAPVVAMPVDGPVRAAIDATLSAHAAAGHPIPKAATEP
jgi:acetoin utilization deacetylase AcuC-like enzyme